ncbi:hypothetical protein C7I87_22115 [Mesorhizobium sp. SARCC-RB16n]|uniref:hypothetical protein n=1 Tax=Mesorhizobium sp. SARCC-RB16n TaxID=2116687 RepID=UPI00122EEF42|nr:hypothetical protein [Mesorhizobium sp. SARCC-RB16n]KAA3448411.1 hypothetical protein C7I87_22115 [Mesorhizobium sp. SARCC-RB16n]
MLDSFDIQSLTGQLTGQRSRLTDPHRDSSATVQILKLSRFNRGIHPLQRYNATLGRMAQERRR